MQAKRKPLSFGYQLFNNQLLWSPSPLFGDNDMAVITKHDQPENSWDKLLESCDPVEMFLEFNNPVDQVNTETGFLSTGTVAVDDFGAAEEIVDVETDSQEIVNDSIDPYLVSLSLIERWGSAMGILIILHFLILGSIHVYCHNIFSFQIVSFLSREILNRF